MMVTFYNEGTNDLNLAFFKFSNLPLKYLVL